MRVSNRWIWLVMLAGMLVLSACGGAATPETEDAAGTEPVATEETEADSGDKTETEPTKEAGADEEEPAAETPEASDEDGDEAEEEDFSEARTIDEVESINSYRADITIQVEGDAFATDDEVMAVMGEGMSVTLEVVKDPPAQKMEMNVGPLGNIGYILVDGTAYSGFAGEWFETPGDEAPDISDLTAGLDVEEVADDVSTLERVGEEEINGRTTIHYTGDREAMAAMSEDGDDSLDEIEEGSIDLWIDKEEGFVVRMVFEGTGTGLNPDEPELSGSLSLTMDYYDFNQEIVIEAPKDATSMDDLGEDSFDLGDDPSEALGFELTDLPDGVTPEAFGTIVTFSIPDMSVEDAISYIEEQMAANGYTLDEDSSFPDSGLLYYEGDAGRISAILTEAADAVDVLLTRE